MLAQDYDLYRDGENAAIKAYDISEAERDGTLEYTASVYDFMNDQITYDFSVKGPASWISPKYSSTTISRWHLPCKSY